FENYTVSLLDKATFSSENEMLFEDCDQNFSSENEVSNSQNSFSDEESQKNLLLLHVGLIFNILEEVDKFIELYTKFKGFSFRRSRTDLHFNNSGICRRSYEYLYSRTHKTKKRSVQIVCTLLCDDHKHKMNPIVVQTASCFRKLSNEMLKNIKFYTKSAEGMGAKMQYNLLKAKYLDSYIDKKDLSNAIQKFRIPSREKTKTDTAETLQQLIALKVENSRWVV
ncbi:26583_t:CDS:2, partial [Racocetra persica]